MRASEEFGGRTILVGGGVAANKEITTRLRAVCEEAIIPLYVAPKELSTDNALMIALAGYFRAKEGHVSDPVTLAADSSVRL